MDQHQQTRLRFVKLGGRRLQHAPGRRLQRVVAHQAVQARLSGSPRPNTQKYKGLYVWKRKIVRYENRNGQRVLVVYEGDGRKYVPDFNNPNASCTAYANINPYTGGPQVVFGERMWTVHNHSPNFRIRYIAKFRANNENGNPRWWVMARSLSQNDDDQPWG